MCYRNYIMSEYQINYGLRRSLPPIYPKGPFMLSAPSGTLGVFQSADGMFKREEFKEEDVEGIKANIARDPACVDLDEYQFWTQDNWKAEHGTSSAAERFAGKLIEEHEEFSIAMYGYLRSHDRDHATKELLSEAGDVLWCVNALVSNATGNIRSGLQRYLYDASMGTLVYEHDSDARRSILRHPRWRNAALQVATDNLGDLTYGDLDRLLDGGFMPNISPEMNIGSEDESLTDPIEVFHEYDHSKLDAMSLSSSARQQYGYDEGFRHVQTRSHTAETYIQLARRIEWMGGKMILDIGFVLHSLAGLRLSQAVNANFKKINARVSANRIDKSDGDRTPELT